MRATSAVPFYYYRHGKFMCTIRANKMKFIDIHGGWIRQVGDRHQTQFAKIDGALNPADTFTNCRASRSTRSIRGSGS